MRRGLKVRWIPVVWMVALALCAGCDKKSEAPAPKPAAGEAKAGEAAPPEAASETQAEAKQVVLDKAAVPETKKKAPPKNPAASTAPVGDASPDECAAACKNALTVTLAAIPEDAKPSLKKELELKLQNECPGRCEKFATKASVACITTAKTAKELALCPK